MKFSKFFDVKLIDENDRAKTNLSFQHELETTELEQKNIISATYDIWTNW